MPHARQVDLRANPMRRRRRPAPLLLGGSLLALAGSELAPSGVDPGKGSWYDAANWNPAFVPVAGYFVSVGFSGLAVGWQAFTGLELVNGQEIHRLRLSTVPEPGSAMPVALALGLLVAAARQRRLWAARGATGRS
ncbi:MAG: hypothetical protein KF683_15445 [Rubrivivax sp.]|nr:hypothetical protein [Rubrivivax sp.]